MYTVGRTKQEYTNFFFPLYFIKYFTTKTAGTATLLGRYMFFIIWKQHNKLKLHFLTAHGRSKCLHISKMEWSLYSWWVHIFSPYFIKIRILIRSTHLFHAMIAFCYGNSFFRKLKTSKFNFSYIRSRDYTQPIKSRNLSDKV